MINDVEFEEERMYALHTDFLQMINDVVSRLAYRHFHFCYWKRGSLNSSA